MDIDGLLFEVSLLLVFESRFFLRVTCALASVPERPIVLYRDKLVQCLIVHQQYVFICQTEIVFLD